MDDATSLKSELLNKLGELDQKASNQCQDMAQEFARYAHQLLHNVPEHVSLRVREDLADELMNYPVLGPTVAADPASPFADLRRPTRRGRISPPPVLPHTSGIPPHDATCGSPDEREREREFYGLFTPSYLPLLEVMPPNKSLSGPIGASASTPSGKGSNEAQESPQHTLLSNTTSRPEVAGRLTSETTSPTIRESDACIRKSALRRSSSGSAKSIVSPRRVRFEVEGGEVPTTASPPLPPRLATPPPPRRVIQLGDGRAFEEADVDDASVLGSSPPRPKKISSTERLKALARSSTEDTSKWTVVGNLQDDDEEEDALVMSNSKRKAKATPPEPAQTTALNNGGHEADERLEQLKVQADDSQGVDTNEEMDDVLELPLLTSFKGRKKFASPQSTIAEVPPEDSKSAEAPPVGVIPMPPTVNLRPRGASNQRKGEEEDMFKFEDDRSSPDSESEEIKSKYIEEEELEDEKDEKEEVEEEQITPLADKSAVATSDRLYSKSPAAPIAKPASLPSISSGSSLSKHLGASTGSYNGKPFIIGVVRNEDLHKKAAEMGDIYSFVGSVDGRSGVDESYSYRPDLECFNGTPKSLGERLMEEAYARRTTEQIHKPE